MSNDFPCWYPLQIRFRDLDPLAHVNNTVYFTYFEEARSYYMSKLVHWQATTPGDEERQQATEPSSQEPEPGYNPRIQTSTLRNRYGFLIKETTCTYHLPLVRTDSAEVGVRVTKVGRTSFTMEHQIRDSVDQKRIYATGRSVMVWCDYFVGRPYPLPPTLRHAFEQMEGQAFPLEGAVLQNE